MKAILFDLGGVIIDLAPSKVFEHWGKAAAVTPASLAARWKIDAAYKAVSYTHLTLPTICSV